LKRRSASLRRPWRGPRCGKLLIPDGRLRGRPEEEDLVLAIRNLVRSFPNGYEEQLYLVQQLLDAMTDLPR